MVENRSGGTGLIGMDQVAKSVDGHTIGVMFLPHVVLPSLVPKMPYDTLKDLLPISQTQWTYNVLVVPNEDSGKTVSPGTIPANQSDE